MTSINIYMLNVGHGDSIIIEVNVEDETYWGLIDCNQITTSNIIPALDFFTNRYEIKTLEFICVTHPHGDHFKGMYSLLKYFSTNSRDFNSFWDFNLNLKYASAYAKNIQDRNELDKILTFVGEKAENKRNEIDDFYKIISPGNILWEKKDVKIISLSPFRYDLLKCAKLAGKWLKDQGGRKDFDISSLANSISVVIAICLNDKTIIFGADAEKKLWGKILKIWPNCAKKYNLNENAIFIKASHHGSSYANHIPLWERYTIKNKTIVFISGGIRDKLPSKSTLETISSNKASIYCTNINKECMLTKSIDLENNLSPISLIGLDSISEFVPSNLRPGFGNCIANVSSDENEVNIETQFDTSCIYS